MSPDPPFPVRSLVLLAVADFSDHRHRPTASDELVLEIVCTQPLSVSQVKAFYDLALIHAGPDFSFDVRQLAAIDWGQKIKRLGYQGEVI